MKRRRLPVMPRTWNRHPRADGQDREIRAEDVLPRLHQGIDELFAALPALIEKLEKTPATAEGMRALLFGDLGKAYATALTLYALLKWFDEEKHRG